jgi:uncharacterized protein (DUF1499 family)
MKGMIRVGSKALPLAGLLFAILAAGVAAVSGPGYRWGWWGFKQGFSILRWASYLGALAGAVSLAAVIRARPGSGREGLGLAVAGLLLGGALFAWIWNLAYTARSVPAIHDITTDTDSPPEFSAIVPLRAKTDNTLAYGGAAIAEQQHQGYPDIAPLVLSAPPERVFRLALEAVRQLGWTLVAQDEPAGRIEAFDRTLWYGFVDDVVVRIVPAGAGSRIDVRSVSRIGKSDIGANARRIRRILRAMRSDAG